MAQPATPRRARRHILFDGQTRRVNQPLLLQPGPAPPPAESWACHAHSALSSTLRRGTTLFTLAVWADKDGNGDTSGDAAFWIDGRALSMLPHHFRGATRVMKTGCGLGLIQSPPPESAILRLCDGWPGRCWACRCGSRRVSLSLHHSRQSSPEESDDKSLLS